jgi:hypothetical protein
MSSSKWRRVQHATARVAAYLATICFIALLRRRTRGNVSEAQGGAASRPDEAVTAFPSRGVF